MKFFIYKRTTVSFLDRSAAWIGLRSLGLDLLFVHGRLLIMQFYFCLLGLNCSLFMYKPLLVLFTIFLLLSYYDLLLHFLLLEFHLLLQARLYRLRFCLFPFNFTAIVIIFVFISLSWSVYLCLPAFWISCPYEQASFLFFLPPPRLPWFFFLFLGFLHFYCSICMIVIRRYVTLFFFWHRKTAKKITRWYLHVVSTLCCQMHTINSSSASGTGISLIFDDEGTLPFFSTIS